MHCKQKAQVRYFLHLFQDNDPLPFTYFAVFDGHAGTGAALMAVNTLHHIVKVCSH